MSNPLQPNFKTEVLPWFIILTTAVLAMYFYKNFPDQVVTHWNIAGEPDDWGGKNSVALGLAAVIPGIYLLFSFLPYLDPKRDRYAEFRSVYFAFRNLFMGLFLLVYIASGLANLGYDINIKFVIPFSIGVVFLFIGNYMAKLKPNWFIGIRTPWTLSSENVWNRTHRVGGWIFVLFGIILMATPLLPETLGVGLFVVGVFAAIVGTIGYSYIAYRQEKKNFPTEKT